MRITFLATHIVLATQESVKISLNSSWRGIDPAIMAPSNAKLNLQNTILAEHLLIIAIFNPLVNKLKRLSQTLIIEFAT